MRAIRPPATGFRQSARPDSESNFDTLASRLGYLIGDVPKRAFSESLSSHLVLRLLRVQMI
jgi:hypothetical protein